MNKINLSIKFKDEPNAAQVSLHELKIKGNIFSPTLSSINLVCGVHVSCECDMKFAFGGSRCQTQLWDIPSRETGEKNERVRALVMVTHWIRWIDSSLIFPHTPEHSSLG